MYSPVGERFNCFCDVLRITVFLPSRLDHIACRQREIRTRKKVGTFSHSGGSCPCLGCLVPSVPLPLMQGTGPPVEANYRVHEHHGRNAI